MFVLGYYMCTENMNSLEALWGDFCLYVSGLCLFVGGSAVLLCLLGGVCVCSRGLMFAGLVTLRWGGLVRKREGGGVDAIY